jgi:basic membrane protein A
VKDNRQPSAPRTSRRFGKGFARRTTLTLSGIAIVATALAACGSGGTGGGGSSTAAAAGASSSASSAATSAAVSAGGSSGATSTAGANLLACLMVSSVGVADRSFNQESWDAMQDASKATGLKVKYLAQSGSIGFPQIGDQFVQEGCNIIVGMGFDTADTIQKLAPANPKIKFAVVDTVLTTPEPNAVSLHFGIDQASFLGGYLAAGMSKSGTVGVVGNVAIPPVELYMDGWVAGIDYYNKVNNKTVKSIGWDPKKKTGTFVGNFTDTSKGKLLAQSEIQQGADIVLPLIGGADQAIRAAGGPAKGYYMFWPDTDGCVSNATDCDVLLSSVQKNIETALSDVLEKTVTGTFPAGTYEGTLTNKGVGLAPYHDADAAVPAALKTQITQLAADIASGKVSTKPVG